MVLLSPTRIVDEPTVQRLRDLDGVREIEGIGAGFGLRLVVDDAEERLPQLQEWCTDHGLDIDTLHREQVPFDDVFTMLIGQHDDGPDGEDAT